MASTPSYALSQVWAGFSGTTASKLTQVNALTVAGPNVDVDTTDVAAYLLLQGVYPRFQLFAAGSPTGDATHDAALVAAQSFIAWLGLPNSPPINTAKPEVFAAMSNMGNAVVAYETATPGATGFTQAVLTGLLALAQTTMPWWQANGFSKPVTAADVANAGLA
jgi:hypothetical protein